MLSELFTMSIKPENLRSAVLGFLNMTMDFQTTPGLCLDPRLLIRPNLK